MFEILKKDILNPTVIRMDILAPRVARKAEPGQFIILRTDEAGDITLYLKNGQLAAVPYKEVP